MYFYSVNKKLSGQPIYPCIRRHKYKDTDVILQ